jgi:hypothetical protein
VLSVRCAQLPTWDIQLVLGINVLYGNTHFSTVYSQDYKKAIVALIFNQLEKKNKKRNVKNKKNISLDTF